MHIFFITGLHHLQLLLEGNRVVHVARQHVLRDFSWALHSRPVYTGAAPCSPFWWSWWRCWWTHQRPTFNRLLLGSSLQRVLPWRQYLCTFPTHSQVSWLRSIPDTWPYSDSRSCSDWNHSYTTEPVLHFCHRKWKAMWRRDNTDRWPSTVPYILRKTSHQGSTTGFPCATKEARRQPDRDVYEV